MEPLSKERSQSTPRSRQSDRATFFHILNNLFAGSYITFIIVFKRSQTVLHLKTCRNPLWGKRPLLYLWGCCCPTWLLFQSVENHWLSVWQRKKEMISVMDSPEQVISITKRVESGFIHSLRGDPDRTHLKLISHVDWNEDLSVESTEASEPQCSFLQTTAASSWYES